MTVHETSKNKSNKSAIMAIYGEQLLQCHTPGENRHNWWKFLCDNSVTVPLCNDEQILAFAFTKIYLTMSWCFKSDPILFFKTHTQMIM